MWLFSFTSDPDCTLNLHRPLTSTSLTPSETDQISWRRFSVGVRSGLRLDHSETFNWTCLDQLTFFGWVFRVTVLLEGGQCPSLRSLEHSNRFPAIIFLYFAPCFLKLWSVFKVPADKKNHPHIMKRPPPCFTVRVLSSVERNVNFETFWWNLYS